MCIHYDSETLYFASPTEKLIYRNRYDEGRRKDNKNNYGTIEKLYENLTETSWIQGLTCTEHSAGFYWMNSKRSDYGISSIYRGNWDGGDEPELIVDNLRNATSLFMDNDDEVLYYRIENDLYIYNRDDDHEKGLVKENIGEMNLYFYWEDASYGSDNVGFYQVSDYWDMRVEAQLVVNMTGIRAAAFFIADTSVFLTSHLVVLGSVAIAILVI